MQFLATESGDLAALDGLLAQAAAAPAQTVLVLGAAGNAWDGAALAARLGRHPQAVCGALFPELIVHGRRAPRGALVLPLEGESRMALLPLGDAAEAALRLAGLESEAARLALLFVPGLAPGIGALVETVFNHLGPQVAYLGAGAGSLEDSAPALFGNQGYVDGHALVVLASLAASVGVAHGWQPVSPPFRVTQAQGGRVLSLDWHPAEAVYRAALADHGGAAAQERMQAYPLGIARLGAEMVVRDVLGAAEGALACVAELSEGAYVHVLHGVPAGLLAAAGAARQQAYAAARGAPAGLPLIVDCISRAQFLGADYARELALLTAGEPVCGVLGLGEIASSGHDCVEFLNKTAVLGLLHG